MRYVSRVLLILTIGVVTAGCGDLLGGLAGPPSVQLPEEGTCIAGLEEEGGELVGWQAIACNSGLIWRVDKVFQGEGSCPARSDLKFVTSGDGPVVALWRLCLTRL